MVEVRDGLTLRQLIAGLDAERDLVALEIHDNVLQTMASALHHIQAARQDPQCSTDTRKNLLGAFTLIRQSMDAARNLMRGLRPPLPDRLGLTETLRHDLQHLADESGWLVDFQADGQPVPRDLEMPLYRIIWEAVLNARKHSLSRTLRVSLRVLEQPPEVVAEVRDEGIGFDPASVSPHRMGLVSMQVRARLLDGECVIRTGIGQGTTVTARLPLGADLEGRQSNGPDQTYYRG